MGTILRGVGRQIHSVSDQEFLQEMKRLPERMAARLAFMTREHHLVREFVVREMPRQKRAISPVAIAQVLALDIDRVNAILADLEKHLFFLVRDAAGHVSWAFPVTTAITPHRLTFSTGETVFGA
jgi:hypothetical protein